jgi:starch synthase (maltosyl-transferring)
MGFRDALAIVSQPAVVAVAGRSSERTSLVRYDRLLEIIADRPKARFSTWYEMFPRSQSDVPGQASTLLEAERRLPGICDMGFGL